MSVSTNPTPHFASVCKALGEYYKWNGRNAAEIRCAPDIVRGLVVEIETLRRFTVKGQPLQLMGVPLVEDMKLPPGTAYVLPLTKPFAASTTQPEETP